MFTFSYDIIMLTPLGKKYGIMQLEICRYKVNGYIEILENREPCQGEIDENGLCRLYGRIVTLMQEINYIASGVISENEAFLVLHGEGQRDAFHIIGKACTPAEGESV